MAQEYFCAYHSYLESMEPLGDAEIGRLFKALLVYSKTGAEPDLRGNERFIFPTMKQQIDRDAKKYEARCEQNRQNVLQRYTGADDGIRASAKPTKEKEKEKTKTKENTPPLPPSLGGCGPELNATFSDWLAYKSERRQGYKPTGLKALISRVEAAAQQHGEKAVIDLIRECMANGYQGIIWDRLKGDAAAGGKPKSDRDRIRTAEDYAKGRSFFDD